MREPGSRRRSATGRASRALPTLLLPIAAASLLLAAACGDGPEAITMRITSPSFAPGARIPRKHTKEGKDYSPPLVFHGVPGGARQLALICDDPDAPGKAPWVHWVLYRIPGSARDIEEDSTGGGIEGSNDFGEAGYGGPMPPPGSGPHHYHFRLYAVDRDLDLGPGATKTELLAAMEGHVLATAELVGVYQR